MCFTKRDLRYVGMQAQNSWDFLTYENIKNLVLITNNSVDSLCRLKRLRSSKRNRNSLKVTKIIIGVGERYKRLRFFIGILKALLYEELNRDTKVVSFGGGVLGDIAGFIASCYMRSVKLIHIPTTLLAQVDSSIGGKNGLNTAFGKNLVGALHMPGRVILDISNLSTLSQREWVSGLAEVIKIGAALDGDYFKWLEKVMFNILDRKMSVVIGMIKHACLLKLNVTTSDSREIGVRSVLNFGHTFGHAIESYLSYQKWLHGEAVSCGMVIASDISFRLGLVELSVHRRLIRLLSICRLPIYMPSGLKVESYLKALSVDKKSINGLERACNVVLIKGLGQGLILTVSASSLESLILRNRTVGYKAVENI
ncbi:3-dehydroquinate synthase [Candidatus Tremblaya phenacola]|uniref:3-dehydroquinate synthase n=1 Tax=Candidatus Tremblayella phenacoccinincola TaxID=1010676 RepID=A0A2G0V6V5_9PROT|nr:3-dehydroquinate synthase [Candidatus Tremblaya phenacola]PHN16190.1 3-dehydroquinate synthase [Candidatus Tremblaya phenacola]